MCHGGSGIQRRPHRGQVWLKGNGGLGAASSLLLEQAFLHLPPGVAAALVGVHAEEDAQAAGQAAGLLLQQVGLGLPFETWQKRPETQSFNYTL